MNWENLVKEPGIFAGILGLVGVIVGTLLSIIGNAFTQWLSMNREERLWKRQREAAKEDSDLLIFREDKEKITKIYLECLSSLSLIIYLVEEKGINDIRVADFKPYYENAIDCITKLKLHLRDEYSDNKSDLRRYIDGFICEPEIYSAPLLKEIEKQLMFDKLLFKNFPLNFTEAINKDTIEVCFRLSDSLLKEEFIRGNQLHVSQSFEINFKDFSDSQRGFLYVIFGHNIPDRISLYLPARQTGSHSVNYKSKVWECNLNPLIHSLQDILIAWENDFKTQINAISGTNKT